MKLSGYTVDKNKMPVTDAMVEVKDDRFQTLYRTASDENGFYEIEAADEVYPFLIAVKDYGVNNLEYWCQNLDLRRDQRLDVAFDKLEIYGLHAFAVKGGLNALMVYFRPMSLVKFQAGEANIAPEIAKVKVSLDGIDVEVLVTNEVKESIGDGEMTAYLIHIENPNADRQWNRLDLELWDKAGNFGAATTYHN